MRQQTPKAVLHIFSSELVAVISSFILSVLIIRSLSKSEYAIYAEVNLAISSLIPLLGLGLPQSMYVKSNTDRRVNLARGAIISLFLIGLCAFLITYLMNVFPTLHSITFGSMIFAALPAGLVAPIFLSFGRTDRLVKIETLARILNIVLVIIFIALGPNVNEFLIATALSNLLLVVGAIAFLGPWREFSIASYSVATRENLRRAWPLYAMAVVGALQALSDRWIVTFAGKEAELADLASGLILTGLLVSLANIATRLFYFRLVHAFEEGQVKEASQLLMKSILFGLPLLAPAIIFFSVFAQDFATIVLPEEYWKNYPLIALSTLLAPVRLINFSSFEVASGKSWIALIIFSSNLILGVALGLFLYAQYSLMGLVLAGLLVVYLFSIPAHFIALIKFVRLPIFSSIDFRSAVGIGILFLTCVASVVHSLVACPESVAGRAILFCVYVATILFWMKLFRYPWKDLIEFAKRAQQS